MINHGELAWETLLSHVRGEFGELYRAWFDELGPGRLTGGELEITVSDPSRARYLRENCVPAFTQAAMRVTGRLITVRFALQNGNAPVAGRSSLPDCAVPLNPDYVFEEFVVGASNRLAHAACRAVCDRPGRAYNPLFIHGRPGLGKTHLLQATAAQLLHQDPGMRIAFMPADVFVNEYVAAIEGARLAQFRAATREADMLILDDLQFLAKRESCQEELFHTFNALHLDRRQIILSADAPPSSIPDLENRLESRFQWGLVVQIDQPDRETRHAILQKKARLRGLEVSADAMDFIAERVQSSIRALEGALITLTSYAAELGKPPTLETAREALAKLVGEPEPMLAVEDILEAVSKHFRVKVAELVGRKRTRSISHPRHVGMYLARRLTSLSLVEIGARFGGRDHSTVLHAERLVEKVRAEDPDADQAIQHLIRRLTTRRTG